jgi:S-DNA-T family DNA segregation ATPase FtsK/SpoIIIE
VTRSSLAEIVYKLDFLRVLIRLAFSDSLDSRNLESMSPFLKKFKQDVFGIVFLAVGLFLALALATFNPKDPSLNSIGQGLTPVNACGFVGSFISDLLYQLLGISSWLLIAFSLRIAYGSFKEQKSCFREFRVIWAGLSIFIFAALVSVYFPDRSLYQGQIFPGGLVGLGIAQMLVRAFNRVGLQIVLWSSALILALFYFEKTVQELSLWPRIAGNWSLRHIKDVIRKIGMKVRLPKVQMSTFQRIAPVGGLAGGIEFRIRPEVESDARGDTHSHSQGQKSNLGSNLDLSLRDRSIQTNESSRVSVNETEEREGLFSKSQKRKVILQAKPPQRIENWVMPKIELLENPPASRVKIDDREIKKKADLLIDKLKNFSIEGQITDAKPGPLVTMYEFKPNVDVKISKISDLEDDLSLALSSESVRVVGHIPGRDVVGIETSNLKREMVYYKDLIAENQFWNSDFTLPLALGRQVNGEAKIVDLRKMPHLLIAGTTGSGKSVFVSSIITGLIFKHSPKTLRFILIDPKMVDLAHFAKIPHLILPHVTEAKKAVMALKWAVREMEKRYRSLSKFGVSKIELFNEKICKLSKDEILEHEKINQELESGSRGKLDQYYFTGLPYIVIVVDELADLMVTEKQNIELPIQRLTQMARACGMHLILATQSPRKDVVTGLIKTNIPGRIALKVASKMDSRIILDESGAERLLPNGDMLFLAPGVAKPMRHHGPYLSDREIVDVVGFWSKQGEPEYDTLGLKALEASSHEMSEQEGLDSNDFEDEHDEMYDQILSWTSEQKEISASLLQRKFRLGYPRAARIVEIFEKEGIVGGANGSKPRQVIIKSYKE